jgi:ferredoxin-nitrite reductase
LFYTTAAQDGYLIRIRVPGGLLTSQQCRVLVGVSDPLGNGAIDVTNRANLQIRGLAEPLPDLLLSQLQQVKLAAPFSQVDHLRNIMASPLAGIDPAQLMDTRPLVRDLDQYLSSQPALAGLPAKFSVGIDGGEQVSIRQQPNDVRLSAVQVDGEAEAYFQLSLPNRAEPILLKSSHAVAAVAAIAQAYRKSLEPGSKSRLKQVMQTLGSQAFLERVQADLSFPFLYNAASRSPSSANFVAPIGIFPQAQVGRFALGIALPLGRLQVVQLQQIVNLADGYGSGSLRLTPWRSLILTDIAKADLPRVQQQVEELGLSTAKTSIWSGLIACSGTTGCASSLTDTQTDAKAIAAELDRLDSPLTIHFSGCPKSCAHHGSSDLTLVGAASNHYHLYIGGLESPFGRQLAINLSPADLPAKINQLLAVYQKQRSHSSQSFREFVDRYSLAQLQAWLEGR